LAYLLTGEEQIMSVREFIKVTNYKDIKKGVASPCYPGLTGMLVATVKWVEISIKENQTTLALEWLGEAMKQNKKIENVVKRYNRRYN
jgi:hypothetical protein